VVKKPQFHILLGLAEGPAHGADIQRKALERTDGAVRLYPVTLYRSLDELADGGFIEEVEGPREADHNERRRYFRLTGAGRKALRAEARALEASARMAFDALESGRS
jgi:DNA-binding PadR family transcriptional regulator